MDGRPTKTPSRTVNTVKSDSDKSSDRPRFFARPWFYIPAAFVLGPVIAGLTKIDNAAVAMGPFFLALLYAALTAYRKSPTPQKVDTIATDGRYVCRSCGSRFNEPKMRGNGWIELILYVFVFIVGGVIYSIWRRSGQNKECPQCGARAFRLASEGIPQQKPNAPTGPPRVPCPECMEPIMPGARKCKHCGSVLVVTQSAASK
jgi:hypothetical protein